MRFLIHIVTSFLILAASVSPARSEILVGRVCDTGSGDGIYGVAVVLTGSGLMALTGDDGRFTFRNAPAGPDTLECSVFLYRSLRIPVTVPDTLYISLEPEPVDLGAITVQARRPDELPPHERTSSSVTVITREAIPERAATIAEVLDTQVGVDVRSLGGAGAKTDVSIRGSTAEQVTVYVDGIPVSAGGSGTGGLSFVPVSQVNRIEVYRGSAPGSFGAGAIGGVINISTAPSAGGFDLSSSASYGSFGNNHQSVITRFGTARNRFSLAAGRNAGENDFSYYDTRGTTIDTSDDGWETRKNSDYLAGNVMLRWDSEIAPGHSLAMKLALTDTEKGVPGLGRRPAYHARFATNGLLLQGKYAWGNNVEVQTWTTSEERSFFDPDDETGRRGRQDTTDEIGLLGASINANHLWGPALFHFESDVRRERFDSSDTYDTAVTPPSRRLHLGIGAESEIMLQSERMWLVPRVHVTNISDEILDAGILLAQSGSDSLITADRTVTSYSLGWRWRVIDALVVRMNAGVYPRLPEFGELFGDTGDVVGNPRLTPEKGRNFDGGFHYTLPVFAAEADMSLFYRYARDLIQRRSYGDYLISENIGKAEITGVETWLAGRVLSGRIDWRASLAWQDAVNRSDATVFRKNRYYGKKLPYHPDWNGVAILGYRITDRVSASWTANWESECYKGPSNLAEEVIPARTIHDLKMTCRLNGAAGIVLEAANIGNDRAPDRWGYPKPGRSFYITLDWNIPVATER